jgi:hypothetical protein
VAGQKLRKGNSIDSKEQKGIEVCVFVCETEYVCLCACVCVCVCARACVCSLLS